jgi:hypothetical protein
MSTTQNSIKLLRELENHINSNDKRIKDLSEQIHSLIKVVATVRQSLERGVKSPTLLNKAVYDSIDLCRASFAYMDYSSGLSKIDPPLTEAEKTLPEFKKEV